MRKHLLGVLAVITLCVAIQQGPAIFAQIIREDVRFLPDGQGSVVANLSDLKPGKYYLSIGRVLTDTEVLLDGALIQRDSLSLGVRLDNETKPFHELRIRWHDTEVWRSKLFEFPVIARYGTGVCLQFWRTFNLVYLGPLLSLLLLLLIVANSRIASTHDGRLVPHLLFAGISFLYTFCLSGIPELFWNPRYILPLLAILRVAYSAGFVLLAGAYSKPQTWLLGGHLACIVALAAVQLVAPTEILPLYNVLLAVYPVVALFSSVQLFRFGDDTPQVRLLIRIGFAWTIILAFAGTLFLFDGGSFLTVWTPSFAAVLATVDFYLVYQGAITSSAELESAKRVMKVASQVAHDIRSPLSALKVVLGSATTLSEEERQMSQTAFCRIESIARDILSEHRHSQRHNSAIPLEEIRVLIERLAAEKRLEFQLGSNLAVSWQHQKNNVGVFVNEQELARILSNLINNAREATVDNPRIEVSVAEFRGQVVVSIRDYGKGISQDQLAAVERGASIGKANGNGLGLSYARQCVQSWGGTVHLESEVGQGTTVSMALRTRRTSREPQLIT